MILSRSHNFLFVHVPKSAGSSVSVALWPFSTDGDLHFDEPWTAANQEKKRSFGLSKHSTAAEIQKIIGDEEFGAAYKFGIVREPYSRAVSMYRFLKYNFRKWPNSEIMDGFHSFADFIRSDFFDGPGPDRLFNPQYHWLTGADGQSIVDRVVKFEALEPEMRQVFVDIGLPAFTTLKPQNVSSRSGGLWQLARRFRPLAKLRTKITRPHSANLAKEYSDSATRLKVKSRYARDFELFGYSSDFPAG